MTQDDRLFSEEWRESIEGAQKSTVGYLTGGTFSSYARILHPATDEAGRKYSWKEIAGRRQVRFDPSTSSWCDTSGVSLDRDAVIGDMHIIAPAAGLGSGVMSRLMPHLSERDPSTLVGYVEYRGPSVFAGVGYLGAITLRGVRFGVHRGDRPLMHPVLGRINPNLWWDREQTWLCVSDDDLACSYFAGSEDLVLEIHGDRGIETAIVDPATPFHEQVTCD